MRHLRVVSVVTLAFVVVGCRARSFHAENSGAQSRESGERIPGLNQYAFMEQLQLKKENFSGKSDWQPATGVFFKNRNGADGCATQASLKILIDNPKAEVSARVTTEDGIWKNFPLEKVVEGGNYSGYNAGNIDLDGKCLHGRTYRVVEKINGHESSLIDPSAAAFTTPEFSEKQYGKKDAAFYSVLWDFERQPITVVPPPDLRGKHLYIAEVEAASLVAQWKGGPAKLSDTYKYVASSGVIDQLKSMGYNAVEFLPFTQSGDPDAWQYRYQTYGRAPDTKFGTPDEFRDMIQAFNQKGLLVVMDAVVGHYPYRGNSGVRLLESVGLGLWKKANGQLLYGSRLSPWGTYRYDYDNPGVSRYLTDNVVWMMKQYGVGGVRIDNYDGVHDYSENGKKFLKDLSLAMTDLYPQSQFIGEIFFGNNAIYKGARKANGLGVNFRNHANFFDAAIKDSMLLPTEQINMNDIRMALRDPVMNWQEAARFTYITTHDEAANRRDGATGSYPATLIKSGNNANWGYVEKKVKAFSSLAMAASPAYLDLPQARLLQEGSFGSKPAIEWNVLAAESQKGVDRYFTAMAKIMDTPAFAFQNIDENLEYHTDYNNKIMVLRRTDHATKESYYVLVSLSHQAFDNYEFGIDAAGKLDVALDGNAAEYRGDGDQGTVTVAAGQGMHGRPNRVRISRVAPYQVLVLKGQ